MYKYYAFLFIFFLTFSASSQEMFGSVGLNSTKYDYTNSLNESLDGLQNGSGLSVEAGISHYIFSSQDLISHSVSLTLNQFNASAVEDAKPYSWKTTYMGIQNVLKIKIFTTQTSLGLDVKAGFNLSHIISGKQNNNQVLFDITKNPEFSGIFIQPLFGLEFYYEINRNVTISCGHNYSKAFNTKQSIEKLSFSNNQTHFGLRFTPK